ncbi:MAG: SRPBCC family protein [Acidimicrobiia bacterium]|nr:SRPBCC family protein [Acidimicrobiia bacterium]
MTSSAATTRQLRAPVEQVWGVLAGFDDIATWAPAVVDHSSGLGGPDGGVGAARRVQSGRVTIVETVERWDPPKLLAYRLDGLPGPLRKVTNEWQLEPSGDGTLATLTSTVDVGPRPPHRLIERIALKRLGKVSEGLLDGLAAHVGESR